MKTIYLAGNIAYTNKHKAFNWRYMLLNELHNYFKIIIPTNMKQARRCLNRDFQYIKDCDIFLAKINKVPSWGTAIEIYFAHLENKYVVLFTTENIKFHGWLKVFSNKNLKIKKYSELVNYLKKLK